MVFPGLQRTLILFHGVKGALGWSTARRCTYRLNVYLQAVDHKTQRITVYAEILGSSNEALFELTRRLRVVNAILVHM